MELPPACCGDEIGLGRSAQLSARDAIFGSGQDRCCRDRLGELLDLGVETAVLKRSGHCAS